MGGVFEGKTRAWVARLCFYIRAEQKDGYVHNLYVKTVNVW
jgi:hypothetical protein